MEYGIAIAVACGLFFLFVVWVAGQIVSLERRLETERDLRRDLQNAMYKIQADAAEAYRALGLTREPSTPAKWVKKD